jgi:hypothetical protein
LILSISCSDSETEKEYFPDFERIEQFKMRSTGAENSIDSNIRYYFDSNNNYSSFGTGSLFFEVYSEPDSLVIDDHTTNVTNLYVTRRCIKFNPNSIIVYTYDNRMEYIENKSIVYFNEKKIITRIQSFADSNIDTKGFLDGYNILFYHNSDDNLTKIEHFFNESQYRNPITNWRKIYSYGNFKFMDHSFPSLVNKYKFIFLPEELFNILYNKGFRFSKNGVFGYDFDYIDYDESLHPHFTFSEIQQLTKFQYEVESFTDNTETSNNNYFVSFKAIE